MENWPDGSVARRGVLERMMFRKSPDADGVPGDEELGMGWPWTPCVERGVKELLACLMSDWLVVET